MSARLGDWPISPGLGLSTAITSSETHRSPDQTTSTEAHPLYPDGELTDEPEMIMWSPR